MEVAESIRKARRGAGLTQAQLAKRAGTSQPAVARYESGRSLPTLPTLERLLLACGRRPVITSVAAVRRPAGPLAARLRRRRRRLLEAAGAHGARNVRVFGSVARGDEGEESDIDLLVDLDPGRTIVDLAGLRREAAAILGASVDVATPDMLKGRARAAALDEAVPL